VALPAWIDLAQGLCATTLLGYLAGRPIAELSGGASGRRVRFLAAGILASGGVLFARGWELPLAGALALLGGGLALLFDELVSLAPAPEADEPDIPAKVRTMRASMTSSDSLKQPPRPPKVDDDREDLFAPRQPGGKRSSWTEPGQDDAGGAAATELRPTPLDDAEEDAIQRLLPPEERDDADEADGDAPEELPFARNSEDDIVTSDTARPRTQEEANGVDEHAETQAVSLDALRPPRMKTEAVSLSELEEIEDDEADEDDDGDDGDDDDGDDHDDGDHDGDDDGELPEAEEPKLPAWARQSAELLLGTADDEAKLKTEAIGLDDLQEIKLKTEAITLADLQEVPTICTVCNAKNPSDARWCKACSRPLRPWRCGKCKHVNPVDASFCVKCQEPLQILASPLDVEEVDE